MSLQNTPSLALHVFVFLFKTVADSCPVLGASDYQGHFRFETWLIKDWKHVETVECLKLTVQVLLLVTFINVRVKTNSILVVKIEVAELNGVPAECNIRNLKFDLLIDENVVTAE
jgi:hypothetical protein